MIPTVLIWRSYNNFCKQKFEFITLILVFTLDQPSCVLVVTRTRLNIVIFLEYRFKILDYKKWVNHILLSWTTLMDRGSCLYFLHLLPFRRTYKSASQRLYISQINSSRFKLIFWLFPKLKRLVQWPFS